MGPDPGECPICGAAHGACGPSGPIAIAQLPQRDALASTPVAESQTAVLGDGSDDRPFSTATYRGTRKRR